MSARPGPEKFVLLSVKFITICYMLTCVWKVHVIFFNNYLKLFLKVLREGEHPETHLDHVPEIII